MPEVLFAHAPARGLDGTVSSRATHPPGCKTAFSEKKLKTFHCFFHTRKKGGPQKKHKSPQKVFVFFLFRVVLCLNSKRKKIKKDFGGGGNGWMWGSIHPGSFSATLSLKKKTKNLGEDWDYEGGGDKMKVFEKFLTKEGGPGP